MVESDRVLLANLWVASWREVMPGIDFEARRGWITGFLAEQCHRTLVAEVAARPAGFASLEGDYLHQLVVAPETKGMGLAIRLLDAAKARSPNGLTLDVNQANARAVRFYVREGFVTLGSRTNPTSGLPTWRMRWRP